jgi:hypothetical protein
MRSVRPVWIISGQVGDPTAEEIVHQGGTRRWPA